MFRVCGWYDSRAQVSALEHSTGLRPLASLASRTPNVLTTQSSAGMGVLGMLGVAEVLGLG